MKADVGKTLSCLVASQDVWILGNLKADKNGNILDPKGQASRAECAQMIKNLLEKAMK